MSVTSSSIQIDRLLTSVFRAYVEQGLDRSSSMLLSAGQKKISAFLY